MGPHIKKPHCWGSPGRRERRRVRPVTLAALIVTIHVRTWRNATCRSISRCNPDLYCRTSDMAASSRLHRLAVEPLTGDAAGAELPHRRQQGRQS